MATKVGDFKVFAGGEFIVDVLCDVTATVATSRNADEVAQLAKFKQRYLREYDMQRLHLGTKQKPQTWAMHLPNMAFVCPTSSDAP